MTGFVLSERDIDRLRTVDFRLALVVGRASDLYQGTFTVAQARRTIAQQHALVAAGKSETMHSMHLIGRAVDLVIVTNHGADWRWQSYIDLNEIMQTAAHDVGHMVKWGGDWKTIKDGDHWQLTPADPAPYHEWPGNLSSTFFTQEDWQKDLSTTAAAPETISS